MRRAVVSGRLHAVRLVEWMGGWREGGRDGRKGEGREGGRKEETEWREERKEERMGGGGREGQIGVRLYGLMIDKWANG